MTRDDGGGLGLTEMARDDWDDLRRRKMTRVTGITSDD